LGWVKNAWLDDSSGVAIARGDLHMTEVAKSAPAGDLYTYVLEMADKEPDMFGTSIVFERGEFLYRRDAAGNKQYPYTSDSERNHEFDKAPGDLFADMVEIHGDDVVDEPAANPDGLFSAFSADQPAAKATALLDSNPGLLDQLKGLVEELNIDDPMITGFLVRYETNRTKQDGAGALSAKKKKEAPMADEKKYTEEEMLSAQTDAVTQASERMEELLSEFPSDFALSSFKKGLTVDAAKAEYYSVQKVEIDELKAQNEELKAQLGNPTEIAGLGEKLPVDHDEEPGNVGEKAQFEQSIKKYQKEDGLSYGDAIAKASEDNPALADKFAAGVI
jgi:hypothetical protein